MTAPKLTDAQRQAIYWLNAHNGDGLIYRGGTLLAGGVTAPYRNTTWAALCNAGMVEKYQGNRRIRLTEAGKQLVRPYRPDLNEQLADGESA